MRKSRKKVGGNSGGGIKLDIAIILPWNTTLQQSSFQTYSAISTVLISLSALIFSGISFWWSNYRIGKIIVSSPLIYAICLGHKDPPSLSMEIPLIFLNTGGQTRFIQDLKLTLVQNGNKSNELYFANTEPSMSNRETSTLAQQFAIEGHKAYSSTYLFYQESSGFNPSTGDCTAKLSAKIDDADWKYIHEFKFCIREDQDLHVAESVYADGHKYQHDRIEETTK